MSRPILLGLQSRTAHFYSVFIQYNRKNSFKKAKVTKSYEKLHLKIQQVIEEYEIYTNQRQIFPAAHNPEVAGSSPVPATTKPVNRMVDRFFRCFRVI